MYRTYIWFNKQDAFSYKIYFSETIFRKSYLCMHVNDANVHSRLYMTFLLDFLKHEENDTKARYEIKLPKDETIWF